MAKIKVKKSFRFLPPLAWAVLIDVTDLFGGYIPVIGEIFDFVQAGLAYLVFENPLVATISLSELIAAGPFDLFPATTISYLIVEKDLI